MTSSMPEPPPIQAPQPASSQAQPVARSFTLRACLIGLACVALIAGYSDVNALIIKSGIPLAGDHLPVLPIAIIFVLSGLWNPLMGRLWSGLRLRLGELTVILLMMIASAWIPGYGILRTLPSELIRPWLIEQQQPQWTAQHTLDRIPAHLIPLKHQSGDPAYATVFEDFDSGITVPGGHRLPLRQVPWHAWLPVMLFWAPLILLFGIAMCALAALVHRQWSKHEQLAYPLASIYASILPPVGGGVPLVMKSRLFWLGVLPPLIFRLDNWGSALSHGKYFPYIFDNFWLSGDINRIIPILGKVGYNGCGFLQFAIVGIAYFVPSEVGLSMASGYMIFILTSIPIYLWTGRPMPGPDAKDVMVGAFIMYGAMLLFTGRTYFWQTIRRACTRIRADDLDQVGPWAARILLIASAALVVLLWSCFGLDPFIAFLYVASTLLFFLVVTRVVCETGIPFFQAEFDMSLALCTMLGFPALGPNPMVIIIWLGTILNFDTRVSLMPFAANGLKVAESTGLRLKPLIPLVLLSIVLALGIGTAVKLWTTYALGALRDDYGWLTGLPSAMLDQSSAGLSLLDQTGRMGIASATHGLAKIGLLGQNFSHQHDLAFMFFGALGICAFSAARFRFVGFPLHPVIFLIWGTWPSQFLWFSFAIGWVLKKLIVTYGGPGHYHNAKPFFLGLILGETMVAAFFIVAQLIYYCATGLSPGTGFGYG